MQLTLENRTRIPDATVRTLARAAAPRRLGRVRLVLYDSSVPFHGRAYYEARPQVIRAWIGSATQFPCATPTSQPGCLSWGRIRSREEALLALLAHELRHCWQARFPNRPRLSRRSGVLICETDADLFARERLRRWRLAQKA